ncbi:MAG: nucleotide sugar dehydrogenase [Candidatus Sericytochromatia bacterium]|nr:nucleotide sugar dehydrogenase [Candidatus Sericytochromatia bacterium]
MIKFEHICVLGLGYIGLPTASLFATNGFRVTGVDTNPRVVETVNRGEVHIEEPGLNTLVHAATQSGRLVATSEVPEADVYIIAVPTPIAADKRPDLSAVEAAARAIAPRLRPHNLVILESTSPPGTSVGLVWPILAQSGLEPGKTVHLAHCPERVLPGQILFELLENSRVVGGFSRRCGELARGLYASIVGGAIHVTDVTTAEMVKVTENTFRDVNIALANELALVAERVGVDVWEVIRLANLHPRVNLLSPGPGVGGHCISVDPWFLVDQAPAESRLITTARRVNDAMPAFVEAKLARLFPAGQSLHIAVLGAAYKGNVGDHRESPALEVVRRLEEAGHTVAVCDPHVTKLDYPPLVSVEEAFTGADCVLLLTPHNEFRGLDPDWLGDLMRHRVLLDTRAFLDRKAWQAADFQVMTLGDGTARPRRVLPRAC